MQGDKDEVTVNGKTYHADHVFSSNYSKLKSAVSPKVNLAFMNDNKHSDADDFFRAHSTRANDMEDNRLVTA